MANGVRGYMLKDAPAEDLAKAIRTVHVGGKSNCTRIGDGELGRSARSFGERERQVLRLAGTGSTSGEIAKVMHLSEGTVRNYLSEAISKLNAKIGSKPIAWRVTRAGCKAKRAVDLFS